MAGRNQLRETDNNVEEVTMIMMENLERVEEREETLEDLEERADRLQQSGKVFEKTTQEVMEKVKYKTPRKSRRLLIAVGVIISLLVVVVVALVFGLGG